MSLIICDYDELWVEVPFDKMTSRDEEGRLSSYSAAEVDEYLAQEEEMYDSSSSSFPHSYRGTYESSSSSSSQSYHGDKGHGKGKGKDKRKGKWGGGRSGAGYTTAQRAKKKKNGRSWTRRERVETYIAFSTGM